MSELDCVPAVGINTDFIRDHPLALTIQSGFMGASDNICFEDGTPFINIERDLLSAKHRIHFINAQSDQKLFQMEKERFRSDYYAEHPDGSGNNLFQIEIEAAWMGGPTIHISFPNVASGGSIAQFEYKVHTFDSVSTILWGGLAVAEVEKPSFSRDCLIRIAPRVDPLPIIAMIMALTDRTRKRKNGRIGGGTSAGFYTAGMPIAGMQGAALGASF